MAKKKIALGRKIAPAKRKAATRNKIAPEGGAKKRIAAQIVAIEGAAEKKIAVREAQKKKIAIVGFAPSSINKAPYGDKSFEIWGVNELYKIVPRVDVLFELHDREFLASKDRNPQHLEWLRKAKIPIFMQEHYEDIPQSIPYPKDAITKDFGRYFTNSISWMLALAIATGTEEIQLYGVDMATNEEYQHQRPSVEYFIGFARGRGIKVYIPSECDMLKCFYLYGYEDSQATQAMLKMKARVIELQQRIQGYQGESLAKRDAMNQMIGAADDVRYWQRCWSYGSTSGGDKCT